MKRINLDNTFKENIIKKFTDYINTTKFTNDVITFTTPINSFVKTENVPRPTIYISATACLKMMLYVRDTETEIAWHGTVERNQEHNWYHIKDVFLYPQTLTAVTVDTDQEKYQDWLQNIEDDNVFNNIRLQGHSHVNMGTSPSGTDTQMYHNFLQVLPKNDYYIFMIMNKSGSINWLIYDLNKNLIYENNDIDVKILTDKSQDLIKDIKTEKQTHCTRHTPYVGRTWTEHTYPTINPTYTTDYDDEEETYVDKLFKDLDNKYKNPILKTTPKNKKKTTKKGEKI